MLSLAVLVAAFVGTGFLGAAAFRMDRARRAAIDEALKNYTTFAASDFASILLNRAYWSLKDVFRPVAGRDSPFTFPDAFQRRVELRTGKACDASCETPALFRDSLAQYGGTRPDARPPLERLVAPPSACAYDCELRELVQQYFRRELSGDRITVLPGPGAGAAAGARVPFAQVLDTTLRRGVFVTHAPAEVDGRTLMLVYVVRRQGPRESATDVYGFVADAVQYVDTLARGIHRDRPLLPPALVGRAPGDSLYSVVIADSAGRVYFRSAVQYESRYRGKVAVDPNLGPLTVELTLRPETAERLVMGGIPESGLPIIVAVFALTTLLLLIVVLQLKREYDWARARDDFVSGVSHELRTPLSQIVLFSDLLRLDKVEGAAERRKAVDVIAEEARRLIVLVENLLRFSRGPDQGAQVHRLSLPVAPLVRDVVASFAPLAASRGARIETALDERLVASIDPQVVRQILLNLLDNAVKYGPESQTVRVGAEYEPEHGRALLWVEDQGPGVPPGERERIWLPFARSERHVRSATAGSGIGLAIVRDLAALHGGAAWVEDARGGRGGGSRFLVALADASLAAAQDPPGD